MRALIGCRPLPLNGKNHPASIHWTGSLKPIKEPIRFLPTIRPFFESLSLKINLPHRFKALLKLQRMIKQALTINSPIGCVTRGGHQPMSQPVPQKQNRVSFRIRPDPKLPNLQMFRIGCVHCLQKHRLVPQNSLRILKVAKNPKLLLP